MRQFFKNGKPVFLAFHLLYITVHLSVIHHSGQLFALNDRRRRLAEEVLRDWDRLGIDLLLTPGYSMPAPPLGYPIYLIGTFGLHVVFNMLDFPAGCVPVSVLAYYVQYCKANFLCQFFLLSNHKCI